MSNLSTKLLHGGARPGQNDAQRYPEVSPPPTLADCFLLRQSAFLLPVATDPRPQPRKLRACCTPPRLDDGQELRWQRRPPRSGWRIRDGSSMSCGESAGRKSRRKRRPRVGAARSWRLLCPSPSRAAQKSVIFKGAALGAGASHGADLGPLGAAPTPAAGARRAAAPSRGPSAPTGRPDPPASLDTDGAVSASHSSPPPASLGGAERRGGGRAGAPRSRRVPAGLSGSGDGPQGHRLSFLGAARAVSSHL